MYLMLLGFKQFCKHLTSFAFQLNSQEPCTLHIRCFAVIVVILPAGRLRLRVVSLSCPFIARQMVHIYLDS